MTSSATFPKRFSKVDELALPDHYYLSEDDICFYLGEYTARGGYKYSDTNRLISNFKKRMDVRETPQWRYKGEAIREVAATFREDMGEANLKGLTFVPIPPLEVQERHDVRRASYPNA